MFGRWFRVSLMCFFCLAIGCGGGGAATPPENDPANSPQTPPLDKAGNPIEKKP